MEELQAAACRQTNKHRTPHARQQRRAQEARTAQTTNTPKPSIRGGKKTAQAHPTKIANNRRGRMEDLPRN